MVHKKIYRTPKNLCISSAREFLKEVEDIFSLTDAKVEDVELDTSLTEKADIFGQLLLYKFIEYTIHKNCFKHPKTNLKNNTNLKNRLEITGFLPFVNEFMNKKNNQLKSDLPEDYNLDWKESGTFYIAPIVLSQSNEYADKEEVIYNKIRKYYNSDSTIVGTITSCISEIGSNFMEHADEHTNSVMVASGNRDYFEIAFADTGKGSITTMQEVMNAKMEIHDVLRNTLNRGVTSKPGTPHSGAGLWLISQYVSFAKGEMCIFSEGAYCHQRKNNIKKGQCGKWKGTIIYVKIPLFKKDEISAGKARLREQFDHVKLSLV